MAWRDDPDLPPRWRSFGEAVVAARPDWETFILGAVDGYGPLYEKGDVRFIVEIPSGHPTIREPLVAELADREYPGHIDVYRDRFFEHVIGWKLTEEEHFARAINLLVRITEENPRFFERDEPS